MKYINNEVRRQNRLLEEKEAISLLDKGEYGVLSMSTKEEVYGIPLNYVWDKEDTIYFHCAPEGKKLHFLKKNNKVSFCIVGKTEIIPDKFTSNYESIIIKGSITIDLPSDEKTHALQLLVDKYSPKQKATGEKYIENSSFKTTILRLDIEQYSGKCNLTKSI